MHSIGIAKHFFQDGLHPFFARFVAIKFLKKISKERDIVLGELFGRSVLFANFKMGFKGYIELSSGIKLLILGIS